VVSVTIDQSEKVEFTTQGQLRSPAEALGLPWKRSSLTEGCRDSSEQRAVDGSGPGGHKEMV